MRAIQSVELELKKKKKMPSVIEDVEQVKHSGTVDRSVNWCKIFWKPIC